MVLLGIIVGAMLLIVGFFLVISTINDRADYMDLKTHKTLIKMDSHDHQMDRLVNEIARLQEILGELANNSLSDSRRGTVYSTRGLMENPEVL